MTPHGWLLIAIFVLLVGATIRPLGSYMAWVFSGQRTSNRFLGLFERAFFRLACVDPSTEQNWFNYALALLHFNLAGVILLFGILLFQGLLPLNPQGFGAVAPDLALNTAVSFVTNTSWQAYAGNRPSAILARRPASRSNLSFQPQPGWRWRSLWRAVSPAMASRPSEMPGSTSPAPPSTSCCLFV